MLWKYVIYKCCEFEFGDVVGRILDVFHGNRVGFVILVMLRFGIGYALCDGVGILGLKLCCMW